LRKEIPVTQVIDLRHGFDPMDAMMTLRAKFVRNLEARVNNGDITQDEMDFWIAEVDKGMPHIEGLYPGEER
jgi:hypothetical protein